MTIIQRGQKVLLLCSSFLNDGKCIDSHDNDPIRLIAGAGKGSEFSKTVSHSLLGMKINETKHFKVPARFAFGERDLKKIYKIDLSEITSRRVGDEIQIKRTHKNDTQIIDATIIKLEGERAHVDTNHPLAGEDLIVKITVISFD